MDATAAAKLPSVVSNLTSLLQLVSEHAARQDTTLAEAQTLTEAEMESTPRFLSPIEEEEEDVHPVDVCLALIKNMTIAFNRVFDMEQAIVGLYKEYVEGPCADLKRSEASASREAERLKVQLRTLQRENDREVDKVTLLNQRLEDMKEELATVEELVESRGGRDEEVDTLKKSLANLERMMNDRCPRCAATKEKLSAAESGLSDAKLEIEELREECQTLTAKASQAESALLRTKETDDSLRVSYESLLQRLRSEEESSLTKSQKNLDELKRRAATLEDEKELRETELSEAKHRAEEMEIANSDLIRRLEVAQMQINSLTKDLKDCESDSNAHSQALEKAQILIKKLNDECERTVRDLKLAENRSESAKKETRAMERAYAEMNKRVQDVEILRKTEERLRQELATVKQNRENLEEEKEAESADLHATIDQILDEKSQLENGLAEMEKNLMRIDRENEEREHALQTSQSSIRDLESELSRRTADLKALRDESESRDLERDAEIALYKRQAENVLRYYQSVQSSGTGDFDVSGSQGKPMISMAASPAKKKTQIKLTTTAAGRGGKEDENKENFRPSKHGQISISSGDDLLLQLESALHRESVLKRELEQLSLIESSFLQSRIQELSVFEVAFRPEIERWMMRNEEMEQRLMETAGKNVEALRLLFDTQKIISIRTRQMNDQRKGTEALRHELQATVDFLLIELQNRDRLILEELIPRSQATLSSALSAAHGKIQQMNTDFARLRSTAEEACSLLEKEKDRSDGLLTDNQHLTQELVSMKEDWEHVFRLLTDESRAIPTGKNPTSDLSLSNSETVPVSQSIFQYITELVDREKELSNELSEKKRLFQELNSATQDRDLIRERFQDEIRGLEMMWKEKEMKWTNERISLAEEIRQIKAIAQKDSDAKLGLQTQLEAEVENYRTEIESLHSQLSARNSEAVSLHKRLSEAQKSLDSLISEYEIAKSRLLNEVETMEIQLQSAREELKKAKNQARASQDEVRTLAQRHEQTVQALHEDLRTVRPKSVLATYQALSAKASPYSSPSAHRDVEDPPSDRLVQDLYLTKAALKQREEEIAVIQEDLRAAEQSLSRKTAYASDLEQQLEFFRNRKDPGQNQMFLDTEVDTFKMDVSEVKAEPQPLYDSLEDQLSRLKKKREGEKRSFQKRVKEFELILRYLEDQINSLTDSSSHPPNPKMSLLISELALKNSTLDAWLKALCQKLENYGKTHVSAVLRERKTVSDIATLLISLGVNVQEAKNTLDFLDQEGVDMERISYDLISILRTGFMGTAGSRHRKTESFGAIKAVLVDLESAELLRSVTQEVEELERLCRERAGNLLQVSTKADDLVSSVRHMDRTRPSSDRILDKVLDMFQKIFRSFQSDLSSDLLHLSALSESLNQVLGSSPEADSSQVITMSSYNRRTSARLVKEDRPRIDPPLLAQMDRLNTELVRH